MSRFAHGGFAKSLNVGQGEASGVNAQGDEIAGLLRTVVGMIRNDLLPKAKTWLFASFNEARGILLHSSGSHSCRVVWALRAEAASARTAQSRYQLNSYIRPFHDGKWQFLLKYWLQSASICHPPTESARPTASRRATKQIQGGSGHPPPHRPTQPPHTGNTCPTKQSAAALHR